MTNETKMPPPIEQQLGGESDQATPYADMLPAEELTADELADYPADAAADEVAGRYLETRPHIGMPEAPADVPTTAEDAAAEFGDDLPSAFDAPPAAAQPLQTIDEHGDQVQAAPNPLAMLASALEAGHDVEKLGALMDLAERYEANEARKAFAGALSQFQADCPDIIENRIASVHTDTADYTYRYADLDQIMRTIRPTLKACGLSVRFNTEISEDGKRIKSLCTVQHRDGHAEVSEFVAPVDERLKINDSQKMGSANSYASRYNLCNALGLTTGEDDDGAAGELMKGAPPPTKAGDIDEFFPVGKHKGERWDAVPLDYLEWVVANLTDKPDIVERARKQIDARLESDDQAAQAENGDPAEPTLSECARLITNAKTSEELATGWKLVPDKHREGVQTYYETRKAELAGV